ncbi:hypothetical protein [Phocaeicola salanitronis]|uniref:hypothetical protein n=1 Tax=Phocaeicola salanitronis TaxID=376805 RepID=UPI0023F9361B|nr:hypothetical protein [Phocaeicola salanitronis]
MKKIRYIILMALCAIGMSACQDDLIENVSTGGADASKPVKVDLKFGIPKSMEVEVTRADNSYSGMYRARLYVFSDNTLLGEPQDVSTADGTLIRGIDAGTSETGQYYTAQDVTLYEGIQTVYAIGNTQTGYWKRGTVDQIDEAAREGLENFKAVLYTLSSSAIDDKSYPSFSTQYMPLSGSGEVTVTDDLASGTVELKRLVAQIKFEIKTLYETDDKTVTFEPSNYTFHNIATQAYVLGGQDKTILTTEVYDANPVNISGAGSDDVAEFSVFIPENIQNAKQAGAGDYDGRESFSGQGDEKIWTYAPDNGTYVVISGVCTEEDNTGKLLRYGNVEYTIHLGDFSDSGSMDNFSVERNCIYTYKVSVHGMDKIKVEAKREGGDYQNGAEGDVIELGTGSKTFSLDAHYEQVFVEYNLSDILDNVKELHSDKASADAAEVKQNIANQFRLVIHTPMNTVDDKVILPYNSANDEATDMAGIDYKWVEFYPQTADNTISLYPGKEKTEEGKKLYSPYQVCQMMGKAIYALYQDDSQTPSVEGLDVQKDGSDYVARFTIFVDEYFYTEDLNGNEVAWDKFTRQDPRTMMIASDMEISGDLNSTYSIAQTYITQHAIETFYNPDAASYYNALGIETYNETGVVSSFSPQHTEGYGDNSHNVSEIPVSNDQSKGRDNMLKNMEIISNNASATDENWTTKKWNAYINFANVGYTDDNSASNNRWSGAWNAQTAYAYYACMSRNRDLNGDGEINPSEVRWYLPALSQYLRIGIGKNALPAETRLFTGDASTMTGNYPNDYLEQGALYYTNTSIDDNPDLAYSIYWAVEVGAYGAQNHSAMVRCVRNLPNQHIVDNASSDDDIKLVNRDAWAGPVYDKVKTINNGDNYLFDFGDRLVAEIFRNSEEPQYGPYEPHNEEDVDEMMLPNAFVVAEKELYVRYNLPQIPLGTYSNRAEYNGTDVEHNATFNWSYSGWRDDPCSSYYENWSERGYWRTPSLNELMVMSTVDGLLLEDENTYSRTQFTQPKREIFYYNASGFITTSANEDNSPGYIRCVRDATQAERDAAQ